MDFRLGELFCGAGGLAWGALQAGQPCPIERQGQRYTISHTWANDLDLNACRTYASNLLLRGNPDIDMIDESIISTSDWINALPSLPAKDLPSVICGSVKDLAPHISCLPDIDGFAFGFPCNDFSAVGERKGLDGEFGPLYRYGIEVLNVKQPRWFIAENVEGLLHRKNSDGTKVWDQIRKELEEAGPGYKLVYHIYRFEQYEVPQYRSRLVIVGISMPDIANGIEFRVPAPTSETEFRTVAWAMNHDPTQPDIFKPLTPDALNHREKKMSERVRRRLENTKPGQNAWNASIPDDCALNVKKAHLSMIYRRLEANEPAYTITGNGGGGTHGYHWSEPRALTNRERARLQSFPDGYHFHGTEESIRRQIGMAVPPLAAKIVFEAILKTYAKIEYPYVEPSLMGSIERRRYKLIRNTSITSQETLGL